MPPVYDPKPVPNEAQLISGGLLSEIPPAPASQDNAIQGGAPSADQVLANLASGNGSSLSSFDLNQLYSPSLRRVLGVGIGYSTDGTYYPGLTGSNTWSGQKWAAAYYADPTNWNIALKLSGYYRGKDDPRLGLKSDDYVRSFGQLLNDAALSRKTITEMLGGSPQGYADLVHNGKVNLDAIMKAQHRGRAAAKQPIRYSNANDLKEQAKAAALDTLGFVPDDAFLGNFVKLYHGMEGGFQKKMYAGHNATEPGNAQVQAAEQARTKYKTEASSYGTVKAFDAFLSIIGANQGVAGVSGQ